MNSRNKPTAPPPPSLSQSNSKANYIHNQIVPENNNPPPPDYNSATQNHETVVHTLISEAMGGEATAKTTVIKSVSDHSTEEDLKNISKKKSTDGWVKYDKGENSDEESVKGETTEPVSKTIRAVKPIKRRT